MPGPGAVLRTPKKRTGGHSLLRVTEDLRSVAGLNEPEASPDRWESGFEFLPNCGTGAGAWLPCETDQDGKAVPSSPEAIVWEPVEHYASFQCSTFAREAINYRERGVDALSRVMPREVEYEFWTGELSVEAGYSNPYLASADATPVEGGVTQSLQEGLRQLQQSLGECLGDEPGDIHAPRRLVTAWEEYHLIERTVSSDGYVFLHDLYGNRVIAGSGYDGRGPGEVAPEADVLWAYGTAPTYHLLGAVEVYADEEWMNLNRATNDELWRAERVGTAVWAGCCHLAVAVSICDVCCTGGS